MGGVVVGDQMQRFFLGRFTIDFFQESQLLGVGMAPADHRAGASLPPCSCRFSWRVAEFNEALQIKLNG